MKSKMMASGGMMKSKMMASGGAMPMKDGKPAFVGDGVGKMKKGGMPPALAKHAAKPASKAHKGLAGGGMTKMGAVKTAAPSRDGIASKGKTKGTMVKMKSGSRAY